MARLVEALRYMPEGGEFGSRWDHSDFWLTYLFQAAVWPWDRLNLWQKSVPGVSSRGK